MPRSSETQFIDANNIDVFYTLSEMTTMARSKTRTVLDNKLRQEQMPGGTDDMMDDSQRVERKLQTVSTYC